MRHVRPGTLHPSRGVPSQAGVPHQAGLGVPRGQGAGFPLGQGLAPACTVNRAEHVRVARRPGLRVGL